jgi:anti-sigma regulatory factor (Ser/Thr protein kinase)
MIKTNFWLSILSLIPFFVAAQRDSVFAMNVSKDQKSVSNCNLRIDSVYTMDTICARFPTSIFLKAQEDNAIFFVNACNVNDSIAFQWVGIDVKPVLCRTSMLRYTNIKGGNYTFLLGKIKNNEFSSTIALPITVKYTIPEYPLFVPSLVFSLLLILGSIAYLWMMYNFRQRMKVQGLRNQIAADLHDEVGSTLSSIAVLSKVLRKNLMVKDPSSLPVLDKILSSSRETILNLRDTVWAINPDNDSFEKLLEKMRSFAYEMLVNEGVGLTYENTLKEGNSLTISMEQRRNVYLMFKECVHNILKHSAATAAKISISSHEEGFVIEINDNGKGFDSTQESEGNGMKILQRRAKECFIQLDIESEAQKGTFIKMIVPEL